MIARILLLATVSTANAGLFYDWLYKAQQEPQPAARVDLYTKALRAFEPGSDDLIADKATALVGRAYAYDDLKQFDAALKDAQAAESISPAEWTVQKAKGYVLADLKRCPESVKSYQAALAGASPEGRSGVARELGLVLRDCSKDYKAADAAFAHAVQAAAARGDIQDLHAALRAAALNACRQKRYAPALQAFARSLSLIDDTGTLYDKAVCEMEAKRLSAARRSFSAVIERLTSQEGGGTGYQETARREVGRTLEITSSDEAALPDSYYRRGRIALAQGDENAGGRDLREACRLGLKAACRARDDE
jgi:tetratricopeptide (TPR) repeat protein